MAKTSKNILDEARAQIKSIDIDEARRMLDQPGTVLLDVREGDEWRQGHIPQAVGIPRGFLELRVEEKVPDHKTPVILQCASGTRSLLAARSLRELGYENVYNLTGGFNAWKDRGLPWVADRQFDPWALVFFRVLLGAAVLVPVAFASLGRRVIAHARAAWVWLVVVGLVNTAAPFVLFSWAETARRRHHKFGNRHAQERERDHQPEDAAHTDEIGDERTGEQRDDE